MRLNPISKIKADLGINPNGRVQAFFTDACRKHMDKYVPKDTGLLSENVDVGNNKITYESPYARYHYHGKKMVMENGKSAFYSPDYGFWSAPGKSKVLTDEDLNYHTPGTGPFWDKKMVSAEMQEVVKEVQEYVNRGK